jgi:hypothetical protein
MIKKQDVTIFFRSAAVTAVALLCLTGFYLGCCRSYEGVRQVCFDDRRPAVMLAEGYIKFFDLEIVF